MKQLDCLYYLYENSVRDVCSETLAKNRRGTSGNGNFCQFNMRLQNMYFCQTNKGQKCQPDVQATCPFVLVHNDLASPIDPVAKDRFRYVISLT